MRGALGDKTDAPRVFAECGVERRVMKKIISLLLALFVLTAPAAWADAVGTLESWTGIRELIPDPERYGEAWIGLTEDGKILSTDAERAAWAGSWQQRTADWRGIVKLQTAHEDYTVLFGIDSYGVLHVCDPLDSDRQTRYVQANGWENVVQVDNCQDLVCAVLTDGSLRVNGSSNEDRFAPYWKLAGKWTSLSQIHFLQTGALIALRQDGRVWYYGPWPCYDYATEWREMELTEPGEQVEQIMERYDSLFFLRQDGSIRIAARDNWADEELLSVLEGWTNVAALISGGGNAVYGLCTDGMVLPAGGIPQTETWTEIAALACSADHVVGLRGDGTVLACGENNQGQCSIGGWRDVVKINAGYGYSLGITRNGQVLIAGQLL